MHVDASGAWGILLLCTVLIASFLAIEHLSPRRKDSSLFYSHIWATAIWGGALAFFLPIALDLGFGPNDDGRVLRQLLLYTTGGVLGVITLSETRRKNDLERSKFNEQQNQFRKQLEAQKENLSSQLEAQKENLNSQLEAQKENLNSQLEAQKENLNSQLEVQKETLSSQLEAQKENLNSQLQSQKDNLDSQLKAQHDNLELQLTSQEKKDKRDHTRQVRAERRSRYTTAVEQLAHEKAAVRLGGIYTLVGLVDEWLEDKALTNEEQIKEGQVIINNLCSYIRSPFPTALKVEILESDMAPDGYDEEKFTADQAALREEQDVRRTIFIEMNKRSSKLHIEKDYTVTIFTGAWSHFDYDFSRSPIFYPINHLTIEKPNFYASTFYGKGEFTGSTFIQRANFSKATFTHDTSFLFATFGGDANFSEATFKREVNFRGTTYAGYTDFRGVTYNGTPDFEGATFARAVNFSGAIFEQGANFCTTHFNKIANFIWALFGKNPAINQAADFTDATFNQGATFYDATFKKNANFAKAKFLRDSKFSRADFSKVTFKGGGPGFLDARHREDINDQQLMKFYSASLDSDKREIPQQTVDFSEVTFEQEANFSNAIFGVPTNSKQIIDFSNSKFKLGADFRSAIFKKDTYFTDSTFGKEGVSNQKVNFFSATFRRNADFSSAVFKADVDFRARIFGQEVDFHLATFSGTTDFSDVIFKGYTGFRYVNFETSPPKFVFTTNSGVSCPAKFVAIPEPGEPHDFVVDAAQSNHTFDMGITTYKGIDYRVPKGTVVFEYPEDWDEAHQEPAKYSSPAK